MPPEPPSPGFISSKQVNLKLKTTRNLRPTSTKIYDLPIVIIEDSSLIIETASTDNGKDNNVPVSPGIQSKIELFDQNNKSTEIRRTSVSEKRKVQDSPEKNDQDVKKSDQNSTKKLRKKKAK